jgi:phosphopantothenoylcysteine decarboxylase/phosphopantothenate--cysteine ligase
MGSAPCVVIGVTGSIAAYKAAEVVSTLAQDGFDVTVIMTRGARQFVAPLTFQHLSRNRVIADLFDPELEARPEHITLSDRARCVCIAPATANVIAKVAAGIADDMLTTFVTAVTCPVLFAPAMNTRMYENRITQRNIRTLKDLGYRFIEPGRGMLACGTFGVGRMAEPASVVAAVRAACGGGGGKAGKSQPPTPKSQ